MGALALAADQQSTKLLLELLNRAGEGGLRDVASFRRAREIQRLAQGEKISDLIELHPHTIGAPATISQKCALLNSVSVSRWPSEVSACPQTRRAG